MGEQDQRSLGRAFLDLLDAEPGRSFDMAQRVRRVGQVLESLTRHADGIHRRPLRALRQNGAITVVQPPGGFLPSSFVGTSASAQQEVDGQADQHEQDCDGAPNEHEVDDRLGWKHVGLLDRS